MSAPSFASASDPASRELQVPPTTLRRVVVVGGGFAGLNLVRHLDDQRFQVVLLDRKNFHTFQPLLYQVATAGLEPASIAAPFRRIFKRKKNFHFRLVELLEVRADKHELLTTGGVLKFDVLVLCHGCTTNFFGNEAVERVALPMKTVPDALNIRSMVLENFEEALLSAANDQPTVDIVIVGGGPTGVELAGAFAELKRNVLRRDYPDFPVDQMQIHLVEAMSDILNSFSAESRAEARRFLAQLGVQVHVDAAVRTADEQSVTLANGERIPAGLLIWAAGVKANATPGLPKTSLYGSQGRVQVGPALEVLGQPDVYAIGDVAALINEQNPKGHPQVAQVAIQQGRLLAKNLARQLDNLQPQAFEYRDKGSMATVGRNRAVVELSRFRFGGVLAWFVWMFVHLMALVGFRNRVFTLINWVANYFTYDRAFRLVFRHMRRRFGGTH